MVSTPQLPSILWNNLSIPIKMGPPVLHTTHRVTLSPSVSVWTDGRFLLGYGYYGRGIARRKMYQRGWVYLWVGIHIPPLEMGHGYCWKVDSTYSTKILSCFYLSISFLFVKVDPRLVSHHQSHSNQTWYRVLELN